MEEKVCEAERVVIWPQPSKASSHQRLEKEKNRFSPRASVGITVLPTPLISDFVVPELYENKSLQFEVNKFVDI